MATMYEVIAGAVPAVHKIRVVKKGEILPESFFPEGILPDLIKGEFVKAVEVADETAATEATTETAATEATTETATTSKKK
jgi:hypothetical protein